MALFADEKTRLQAIAELHGLGYTYVTLDLAGYRSGGRNGSHLDSASPTL
jgi:PP-loop superfamily ATP-utilizing enzyme